MSFCELIWFKSMKKSILWLCNVPFVETSCNSTGSWLASMGHALVATGKIQLSIISRSKVKEMVRRDCGLIRQFLVPFEPTEMNGLPSDRTVQAIQRVAEEIKPDLIHVWGTESYWGLLTARGLLTGPSVLDMQGIKYAYAKVFYGGLSFVECIRCVGLLEILRPGYSLFLGKREFEQWGVFEKEIIKGHKFISVQSDWVRVHVEAVNPECTILRTGIILRKEFYQAAPWNPPDHSDTGAPHIFTSSSGATAYKGLHVIMRAIAILKRKYPRILLNIAGGQLRSGIRISGYAQWLKGEARRLKISDNIRWIGPQNSDGIIQQLQRASVAVIPSFVETYCLALAEAMLVGVPLVVSYAGAMPELAREEESALFFPPGDEFACARQMERILSDKTYAIHLSQNARKAGTQRSEPSGILLKQLEIYNSLLPTSDRDQ